MGKNQITISQSHRTEVLHYPGPLSRLPKQCIRRFQCLKTASTASTKHMEESLPGRSRTCLEKSVRNAKDGDVLCVPFPLGQRLPPLLPCSWVSWALRPGTKGSTKIPPPFDESEDTFLFGNSDGGLLQRRRNSPFGFSSIVRAWGKTSPCAGHSLICFNTTIAQLLLMCVLPTSKAVWLPKYRIPLRGRVQISL